MKPLDSSELEARLAALLAELACDGKRVLCIVPDATRSAPMPLLFRTLCDHLRPRARALDFLIALGTHPPMTESAIARWFGMTAAERALRYPDVAIYNHHWDDPEALRTLGVIPASDTARLTGGLLVREVPVRLNRRIDDYDVLLLCGPVFPHEVAGFSGGAKYLFPGIAGAEIIDFTHWLGALSTSMATIGVRDTPVRRIIHRAAELVPPRLSVRCLSMAIEGDDVHGVWLGPHLEAFNAAAEVSEKLNIVRLPRPVRRVLSMPAARYDDLWTAAKAVYKTEPVVADGGEIIVYAPHLTEVSYTHGAQIDRVGYHVRDYFLGQWERFRDLPWSVLAHSTHVRGLGRYESGIEHPRIQVTLATAIPEERCHRIALGYLDPKSIDPETWAAQAGPDALVVRHAGEKLFRLTNS